MNIDSSAFTVDKYVGTMLQYKSLEELVHRGNAMVSEIKSLDSDMQMLVYENYNKFISATDVIKNVGCLCNLDRSRATWERSIQN